MSAFTTLYTARNATASRSLPLTNDQLRLAAPSLFAIEKHESRSSKFTFVPSIDILNGLRSEGFLPVFASQGRCRLPGKADFTKHMVRLRREGELGKSQSEANEVIWVNAHDGTASSQLWKGIFRYVCSNGCVFGDIEDKLIVAHKGDAVHDVIDGCIRVIGDFKAVETSVVAMKSIDLVREEQLLLANSALTLRFGIDANGNQAAPVSVQQLLQVNRPEDRAPDLWTSFQRIQENTVRGGLHGRSATGRRITTREVRGIDGNLSLNRALWQLAEGMRALKEGRELATA
jgi:hypothetical protein